MVSAEFLMAISNFINKDNAASSCLTFYLHYVNCELTRNKNIGHLKQGHRKKSYKARNCTIILYNVERSEGKRFSNEILVDNKTIPGRGCPPKQKLPSR